MKVSEIIGLKVVTMNNGTQIDDVDDVVYDPKVNAITAVLVDKGGWFSDAKVILFKEISTIGHDAVLIPNELIVKKASELVPDLNEIVKGNVFLTNTKVITDSGTKLGTISDLIFNPQNGQVESLEVSQGALKNIQSGKKHIPISAIVTIGKDRIIVRKDAEQQVSQQASTKGMKGAVNNVQSKTNQTANVAKEKTSDVVQNIQSGFDNVKQKAKDTMNKLNEQPAMQEFKKNMKETQQNIKKSMPNAKQQKSSQPPKKQTQPIQNKHKQNKTPPPASPQPEIVEHKTIFVRDDNAQEESNVSQSNM